MYWETIIGLIEKLRAEGEDGAYSLWRDYIDSAQGSALGRMLMLGIHLGLKDEAASHTRRVEIPDRMAFWSPGEGPLETWPAFAWAFVRGYYEVSLPLQAFVPIDPDEPRRGEDRYAATVRGICITAVASARLLRNPDLLSLQDILDIMSALFTPDSQFAFFSSSTRVKLARRLIGALTHSGRTVPREVAAWLATNVLDRRPVRVTDELTALAIEVLWASGGREKAEKHLSQLTASLGNRTAEERVRRFVLAGELSEAMGQSNRAKQFRRQARVAAIGPGYHDDYQLNEWVAWVSEAVRRHRDEALTSASRFSYYASLLSDETEGSNTMYRALEALLTDLFVEHPKAATELLVTLDDGWKASPVNSSILKAIAGRAVADAPFGRSQETRGASLLLMVAFLSDPMHIDRDDPVEESVKTAIEKCTRLGDGRFAETLRHRFRVLEEQERRRPGTGSGSTEKRPSLTVEQAREFFANASELELVSTNYSQEQRAAFETASNVEGGVDMYLNALDRVWCARPRLFGDSHSSVLALLGKLMRSRVTSEQLVTLIRLFDEHMEELLQFSRKAERLDQKAPWSFSSVGSPFESVLTLSIHLLASGNSRVVLEAARVIGLGAEFELELVLSHIAKAVNSRSVFHDRWLAHILFGLALRHGRPVGELAKALMARFDPDDVVAQTLLRRACLAARVQLAEEAVPDTLHDLVPSTVVFPPEREVVSTERPTVGDTFVNSLAKQVASESKRIAMVSGIEEQYIRSLIEAEIAKSDVKVPFIITPRHGGSIFASHDAKVCAARVVSRLLRARAIDPARRDFVVQALRGLDPFLLLRSPEDIPPGLSRLTDSREDRGWVNGADLSREGPFNETENSTWKIGAMHSEQATEHRYESVTTVSMFVHPQLARVAEDRLGGSALKAKMFDEAGTFGLTFDAFLYGRMWGAHREELPVRHIAHCVGALIPIKQAMPSVFPSGEWKRIGLQPAHGDLQTWVVGASEVFRFAVWDMNDVTEFSFDSTWVGWGHAWLTDPTAVISVFPHPAGWQLVRLSRIERAIRDSRQEPFAASAVLRHWMFERLN